LQAKFNQGMALHQQGKLAAAERIYGEVFRQQPNHFDALHLLGVVALQTRRTERAVELIKKAIGLNAKVAGVHSNLGYALWDLKHPEEALASYDNAIALKPDFAEAYNNGGNALRDLKRPEDALTSYDKAVALKPDYAEAYYNRGVILDGLKRPEDALASYDKAVALKPDHAETYNNRGNALRELKRQENALASFDKAIALKPDYAEAYYDRGVTLEDLKRPDDALASYDKAVVLKPGYAEAYNNRGNTLRELKRPENALASFDKAIALKADYAVAYANRGVTLRDLKRPDALASYDMAIALKPDYAVAYNNRGVVLRDLKRPDALASYDKAIALKPDYAHAYTNRADCLLLMGRFDEGWRQYEWRKKLKEPLGVRSYRQPLWLGEENIVGKTLFIYLEQGLGDTIQFCRYGKLVEARGVKVIMSVQKPLRGLLKQISPTIQVIGPNEAPTDFDYHCPLQSLPLALETTLETIPAEQHYIKADEELRLAWSARLPPKTKPRIGVVWSGGAAYRRDQNRSMELETLLPVLRGDADWICLQKEVREKDLAVLRKHGRIAYFGDDLGDFSNTAALLDLTDLVITVDTNIAHLAGAMGKPVWILLSFSHHCVWLLDRDDSPWYPSARLFRQRQIGNWADVIDQVKSELRSVML
jgi:tetratricopeptide (TPR) repeat protein